MIIQMRYGIPNSAADLKITGGVFSKEKSFRLGYYLSIFKLWLYVRQTYVIAGRKTYFP